MQHNSSRRRDRRRRPTRAWSGRPTRLLGGFVICFVVATGVVVLAVLIGQPANYQAPLINRTDQMVLVQWDPETILTASRDLHPDPTVNWKITFSEGESKPLVTVSWNARGRLAPIYLFMSDTVFSALKLPCPGVTVTDDIPVAIKEMVSVIDNDDTATSLLTRSVTTGAAGATCELKDGYAASANSPNVDIVTPNTVIARSDATAPVVAGKRVAGKRASASVPSKQIQVRATTYPSDFLLDSVQASTNASDFNNGRLRWETSDVSAQGDQIHQASFERLKLRFVSARQETSSGRAVFYSAIFIGLGLGVAAECMFRLLMDKHEKGAFWQRESSVGPDE